MSEKNAIIGKSLEKSTRRRNWSANENIASRCKSREQSVYFKPSGWAAFSSSIRPAILIHHHLSWTRKSANAYQLLPTILLEHLSDQGYP